MQYIEDAVGDISRAVALDLQRIGIANMLKAIADGGRAATFVRALAERLSVCSVVDAAIADTTTAPAGCQPT
jgi:hypothetical protein